MKMNASALNLWQRFLAWPLWLCAFRPFFLATALSAVVFMLPWAGLWVFGRGFPAGAWGPMLWHAHEMLEGLAGAALMGFALTAIPEFTSTPSVSRRAVISLALVWLAARVGWNMAALLHTHSQVLFIIFQWLSCAADLALPAGLLWLLGPRLWRDPQRGHLSFLLAFAAKLALAGCFWLDMLRGVYPMRWLLASVGLWMVLIVLSLSRISMTIVNRAIEDAGVGDVQYVARKPRRNLAIVCILLYTLGEFLAPAHPVGGWLALAASASVFHLLNDWHIGRALLRRWPLLLYSVYVLMALGYGAVGVSILLHPAWLSAARHILMTGALSIAVFAVLNIAGRVHTGRLPDERVWVVAAAMLIALSTAARFAAPMSTTGMRVELGVAATCWIIAFALYLWRMWPVLAGPREDGQTGCAGVVGF